MKHFGDIRNINGADVPIVDVVTGGSPCQDLSVAGKREGLDGERSGLFLEMTRIIKEMRNEDRKRTGRTDNLLRPRYMVFENVEGLFSSNGGQTSEQSSKKSPVLSTVTPLFLDLWTDRIRIIRFKKL